MFVIKEHSLYQETSAMFTFSINQKNYEKSAISQFNIYALRGL